MQYQISPQNVAVKNDKNESLLLTKSPLMTFLSIANFSQDVLFVSKVCCVSFAIYFNCEFVTFQCYHFHKLRKPNLRIFY